MRHSQLCTFGALLFLFLFNGTLVRNQSVTGNELPDVNFSGTITDVDGKSYDVQNITIAGLYKDIVAYPKPNDPTKFSTRNYENLDLAEIKSITTNPENTFKHRRQEYIEIKVTRKDDGVDTYMILSRKLVSATRMPEAGPIAKKIDMNQLKSLTITGYTKKEEDKEKEEKSDNTNEQKKS